jgi:pimeloyl-ACP methyl ester carboxylesterase
MKFVPNRASRSYFALFILVSLLAPLLNGCGARRTPNLERIFHQARARTGKRPLIVIPGILGSQLVDRDTGKVAWPSAFRVSETDLRLPISPDLASNRDQLVASKILDTIKLAKLVPEVYIYHHLLVALNKYGGYAEGDWNNPGPNGDRDTYYVFPYDWRHDNVRTAQELIHRIDQLKSKLNRPDLEFNIVAHSMGGLVARYAAMYGDQDLPTSDEPPVPTWAGASSISKIFMFGTPNEGSADAFSTLLDGYSVTEGLRRKIRLLNKLSREDALTAPSIFQLLPHSGSARFLDENLEALPVDLYDLATWRKYGWSAAYDSKFRQRHAEGKAAINGEPSGPDGLEQLDKYFAAVLLRARRFHEALDVPVDASAPVSLFAFGGDCEETLAAPIILRDRKTGGWNTLTSPREFLASSGKKVTKKEAVLAMFAPGDGRVTRSSMLAETLADRRRVGTLFNSSLPIAYAVFACDLHSSLQNNLTLQDNAITALVSEVMK